MERFYGDKYDATLDIKDIAKLIRKDIAEAKKDGTLPPSLRCSVTIERFAGGQSIDIRVKAVDLPVLNRTRVAMDVANPNEYRTVPLRTPEAEVLLAQLEGMLQAYNHDGSDTMTDYWDVNFYGHATFDYTLEREDRERALAELDEAEVQVVGDEVQFRAALATIQDPRYHDANSGRVCWLRIATGTATCSADQMADRLFDETARAAEAARTAA